MTQNFERAADIARQAGVDAVAFVPGPNFRTLTGLDFHLMERPTLLFVTATGKAFGLIPALERLTWETALPDVETVYWQDSDGFEAAFAAAAAHLGAITIGVEGGRMRQFEAAALARHFGQGAVRDADAALIGLRIVKTAAEIADLERAIGISETALAEVMDAARPGQTERQIANRLKIAMLSHGAEGFAFDPIVLTGGKSAMPHGTPGEIAVQPGDPLLIDFGASFGGMNADITRTFFCEHVSDDHRAIFDTVLAANAEGRAVAGPDITAHDLDTTVTGVLQASPFADLVRHKTGHGLGRDVHEAPQIMIGNHTRLQPGHVLTVEPGLYRAGDIGVRIEDDMLITETGARSLTAFPRGLRCFGGRATV